MSTKVGMYSCDDCVEIVNKYPRHQYTCEVENIQKHLFFKYRYGTSGFRGHNKTLHSVMVRVGLLATLRSMYLGGQAVGIMVTASHNPERDNGVKIIDPSGEMLHGSWEPIATDIANLPEKEVIAYLDNIYKSQVLSKHASPRGPTVFVGYDTRPHSRPLCSILISSIRSINLPDPEIHVVNFAEVTTPQLHYLVRHANARNARKASPSNGKLSNGFASHAAHAAHAAHASRGGVKIGKDSYLCDLVRSFRGLLKLLQRIKMNSGAGRINGVNSVNKVKINSNSRVGSDTENEPKNGNITNVTNVSNMSNNLNVSAPEANYPYDAQKLDTMGGTQEEPLLGELIVDCANGVGGLAFAELAEALSGLVSMNLIHLPNANSDVNDACGAEWVHKDRKLPRGLQFGLNGQNSGSNSFLYENSSLSDFGDIRDIKDIKDLSSVGNNSNFGMNGSSSSLASSVALPISSSAVVTGGMDGTDAGDLLTDALVGRRMASVDGDCDRLMYYTVDADMQLCLVDGDKQICLLFQFLKPFVDIVVKEVNSLNISKNGLNAMNGMHTNGAEEKLDNDASGLDKFELSVAVVQTAYANGASRLYIESELGVKTCFAKTGVKHLHNAAKEFDIGIYFEANGHGTVLVSDECVAKLEQLRQLGKIADEDDKNRKDGKERKVLSARCREAVEVLLLVREISNQAIGDALADVLLCEAGLYYLGWGVWQWFDIYEDLASSLTKVYVKDRGVFELTNAEQTVVKPQGLQAEIDSIVREFECGRAFVRPSGTEECVRVYSEARTAEMADELSVRVRQVVFDMCQGVGKRPELVENID